jgi:hypothetical protein
MTSKALLSHRLNTTFIGIMLLSLTIPGLQNVSLITLSNISSLYTLIIICLTIYSSRHGMWSAAAIYLIAFSLFHFGLTLVFGLGLPISSTTLDYMGEWFFNSFTSQAIILASLGVVAYGLGIHLAMLFSSKRSERADTISPNLERAFTISGYVLIYLSIGGWFVIVVSLGGIGTLIGSYQNFLDITDSNTLLPNAYFGIGLGLTFLAASQPSVLRWAGFVFFGIWAIVALPLGLRGEVLFPTLAALAVFAKQKIPCSPFKAFVLGICLLSLIAFLRGLREVGLQVFESPGRSSGTIQSSSSPLDALTELGAQLRPITEVVYWHQAGEDYIYGASYWAPFGRSLDKLIPDRATQRIAAEDDDRLMNQLAIRRVGAIGFSPVAEAYRNFGSLGVMLIMCAMGCLIGWMDTWATTPTRQVALGIVLLPLLIEVRNDFIAVPFQIISGMLLLAVIVKLTHIHKVHLYGTRSFS